VLDDLAIGHPHDVDDVNLDFASGWLDALEWPQMCSSENLARNDFVALDDLVQDCGVEVWKGGAETIELLMHTLCTGRDPRWQVVVDHVGIQVLGESRLTAPGLVLIHKPPHDIFGLHGASPHVCCRCEQRRPAREMAHRQNYQRFLREQVVLHAVQRGRGSTRDADTRVNVLHVVLGGASRNDQPLGDLTIGEATRHEP